MTMLWARESCCELVAVRYRFDGGGGEGGVNSPFANGTGGPGSAASGRTVAGPDAGDGHSLFYKLARAASRSSEHDQYQTR